MVVQQKELEARVLRLSLVEDDQEMARAFLYFISNELHEEPYALLEDVFVTEGFRGQGYGTQIVQEAIELARTEGAYKLICTSRFGKEQTHDWYEGLGFVRHGLEFRMDF